MRKKNPNAVRLGKLRWKGVSKKKRADQGREAVLKRWKAYYLRIAKEKPPDAEEKG